MHRKQKETITIVLVTTILQKKKEGGVGKSQISSPLLFYIGTSSKSPPILLGSMGLGGSQTSRGSK
jgi:hypothetical protein